MKLKPGDYVAINYMNTIGRKDKSRFHQTHKELDRGLIVSVSECKLMDYLTVYSCTLLSDQDSNLKTWYLQWPLAAEVLHVAECSDSSSTSYFGPFRILHRCWLKWKGKVQIETE